MSVLTRTSRDGLRRGFARDAAVVDPGAHVLEGLVHLGGLERDGRRLPLRIGDLAVLVRDLDLREEHVEGVGRDVELVGDPVGHVGPGGVDLGLGVGELLVVQLTGDDRRLVADELGARPGEVDAVADVDAAARHNGCDGQGSDAHGDPDPHCRHPLGRRFRSGALRCHGGAACSHM